MAEPRVHGSCCKPHHCASTPPPLCYKLLTEDFCLRTNLRRCCSLAHWGFPPPRECCGDKQENEVPRLRITSAATLSTTLGRRGDSHGDRNSGTGAISRQQSYRGQKGSQKLLVFGSFADYAKGVLAAIHMLANVLFKCYLDINNSYRIVLLAGNEGIAAMLADPSNWVRMANYPQPALCHAISLAQHDERT